MYLVSRRRDTSLEASFWHKKKYLADEECKGFNYTGEEDPVADTEEGATMAHDQDVHAPNEDKLWQDREDCILYTRRGTPGWH